MHYLPTYLPNYLPTYLPNYLPTYLPTYLTTYLPTYLPIYLGPRSRGEEFLRRHAHFYVPANLALIKLIKGKTTAAAAAAAAAEEEEEEEQEEEEEEDYSVLFCLTILVLSQACYLQSPFSLFVCYLQSLCLTTAPSMHP